MHRFNVAAAFGLLMVAAVGCQAGMFPPGARQVRVSTVDGVVRLDPSTVRAGDVTFIFEPDPETQHVAIAFAHRGCAPSDALCAEPLPLSDEDIARLRRDAAAEGLGVEAGFGRVHNATLVEGKYAFILPPEGGQTGVPPLSVAVLEVRP